MHVLSILLPLALLPFGAVAAGKGPRVRDLVARDGFTTVAAALTDTNEAQLKCGGNCFNNGDCCPGDYCFINWCNRGNKLEDGTVIPDPDAWVEGGVQRDLVEPSLIEDDLIAEDGEFYYYTDPAEIFNGEKPKPKDKCPKKCGKGKHCCPRHFCQASAGKEGKCLGGK